MAYSRLHIMTYIFYTVELKNEIKFIFIHYITHNLKLKLTHCEFFKSEINYLGHHVSKDGVKPSLDNLEAIAECAPPQTYTDT